MRPIKKLILHCSDSPDTMDIGFEEINRWHKERQFRAPSGIFCGYHYIIRRSGLVEKGRSEKEIGAHAKGFNSNSLGIVWVGRDKMSDKQKSALDDLLLTLCLKHDLSHDDLLGHYELNAGKTCPNLDMAQLRAELEQKLGGF